MSASWRFSRILLPLLFTGVAGAQRPDTVVRVAGAPRHPGPSVREELSIGSVSGADEYTFGKVFDVAVAKDGLIYVLDRSINSIRMYDAGGKYLRTFARRGQGPGEIQSPGGMRVLPDGRVLVWDTGNRRVNVYTAIGTNLSPWMVPASGGTTVGGHLAVDTAGRVHVLSTAISPPTGGSRDIQVKLSWIRVRSSDGVVIDTIPEPELPPFPEPFRARNSRGWVQMAMPFAARRIVTLSPLGYFVTGVADRYAFEVRAPGQPIVSVRRTVAPTPVTSRERDEARNRIETAMREVDPIWTWGGRDLPTAKPFYSEIEVDADGRIWLTRDKATPPLVRSLSSRGRSGAGVPSVEAPDASFVYTPTLYDVFEPSGVFIGQVQMPPKVAPKVIRGDLVWAVARDDDDVEFVRRYRIVWK
jgi:hypothetical protein